jgi:hypothetical protein
MLSFRPPASAINANKYVCGVSVAGLGRLPLVNSYARTPPLVWRLGWLPSPSGDTRTRLPPLPLHFLQERDVLREFTHRVHLLGWTSRQQFEETWMCLLGVLNPGTSLDNRDHVMLSPEVTTLILPFLGTVQRTAPIAVTWLLNDASTIRDGLFS